MSRSLRGKLLVRKDPWPLGRCDVFQSQVPESRLRAVGRSVLLVGGDEESEGVLFVCAVGASCLSVSLCVARVVYAHTRIRDVGVCQCVVPMRAIQPCAAPPRRRGPGHGERGLCHKACPVERRSCPHDAVTLWRAVCCLAWGRPAWLLWVVWPGPRAVWCDPGRTHLLGL